MWGFLSGVIIIMSNINELFIDTYCLNTFSTEMERLKKDEVLDITCGFVGVKTRFVNTLASSIYSSDVLIGNGQYTNLFKLDCSLYHLSLEVRWRNESLEMFHECETALTKIHGEIDPEYYDSYRNDIFDILMKRKVNEFLKETKYQVVFATGSRKHKQIFCVQDISVWIDYLGSKKISHGNNLMSNNQGIAQRLTLKTLIVEDDDTQQMHKHNLGDCHGIVKADVAIQLGKSLVQNPFQFRGFWHNNNAIFKGVLRPVHPAYGSYHDMGEYDLIIPRSSFKYDTKLTRVDTGAYEADVTLIVHKKARSKESRLGLMLQYWKTQESIDEFKSIALSNLQKLNEFVKDGKLNVQRILDHIRKYEEPEDLNDEDEGDVLDTLTTYQQTAEIIKADWAGLMNDHPYIIDHVVKWYASKVKDIAMTAGVRQRYGLACPLHALTGLGNIIVVNESKITDTEGLLDRFPARNSNDVQPFKIINIHPVWQLHKEWMSEDPYCDKTTSISAWISMMTVYLKKFVDPDTAIELCRVIRHYGIHRYENCVWIAPDRWATFGGDFDGDYGNTLQRNQIPVAYEESLRWTRWKEANKPDKTPMDGSLVDQVIASFRNDIGLLSNIATVMNTCMSPYRYRYYAQPIAQQMQIAVDSYKTKAQVDTELLSQWLGYYSSHKDHWIRSYKLPELYTNSKAILPARHGSYAPKRDKKGNIIKDADDNPIMELLTLDCIGQVIGVVNDNFAEVDLEPAKLHHFRDVMPIDPKHYHAWNESAGYVTNKDGIVQLDHKGNPRRNTLAEKMGKFYGDYASELKELSMFYTNGAVGNYYETDENELEYISDERKAEIRGQRKSVLLKYKSLWEEKLAVANEFTKPIFKAALWNVAHSSTSTGAASLCFFLMAEDIINAVSKPIITISMKMVTDAPELLQKNPILESRNIELFIGNPTNEWGNPRPVSIDGVTMGKVYPAPANNSANGSVKMNHMRLMVSGNQTAKLRFIRNYKTKDGIQMAEYEVVVELINNNVVQPTAVAAESF
jgi:hypothetical protein